MPQIMEMHLLVQRCPPLFLIPGKSGQPDPTAEVGPATQSPVGPGEHEPRVGIALPMPGKLVSHERWKVHGADAGWGLRRTEFEPPPNLVQGPEFWVDLDARGVVEVGADPLQPGQLAPPQAGVGGGDGQQPGLRCHAPGQRVHFVGSGVGTFGSVVEADAQFPARIRADQSLVHGFAENHREQHEDVLGALVGQVRAQCFVHPPLDRDARDIAQGGAGPAGQDVIADVRVIGRPGHVSDTVRVRPGTNPLVNRGLRKPRVGEPPTSLVRLHVGRAVIRILLGGESILREDCSVVQTIADTETVSTFFYPRHCWLSFMKEWIWPFRKFGTAISTLCGRKSST